MTPVSDELRRTSKTSRRSSTPQLCPPHSSQCSAVCALMIGPAQQSTRWAICPCDNAITSSELPTCSDFQASCALSWRRSKTRPRSWRPPGTPAPPSAWPRQRAPYSFRGGFARRLSLASRPPGPPHFSPLSALLVGAGVSNAQPCYVPALRRRRCLLLCPTMCCYCCTWLEALRWSSCHSIPLLQRTFAPKARLRGPHTGRRGVASYGWDWRRRVCAFWLGRRQRVSGVGGGRQMAKNRSIFQEHPSFLLRNEQIQKSQRKKSLHTCHLPPSRLNGRCHMSYLGVDRCNSGKAFVVTLVSPYFAMRACLIRQKSLPQLQVEKTTWCVSGRTLRSDVLHTSLDGVETHHGFRQFLACE